MSETLVVVASSGGLPAAALTPVVDTAANLANECAVVGAECGTVQTQDEELN